jgi:cobalamin biosynthesis Mg chelatase CobN
MPVTTPAGSESNSALPPESGNTAANDLMPSTSTSGVSEAAAPGAVSLAEISSRYKAEKGARNARVLGNEDVEKMLANKGGVTMAKNMPPLGPGAMPQDGQPQAGTQAAATSSGSQSASANQQAGTPPASSQGQSTAPDTSAENSTTPQVNQNQQSNDAQGSRRLPATAGFLPLLGLLGLASGGIGFWFRKFRK